MKHKKSKILTLTLASLLGVAALGGAVISTAADESSAAPAAATYSVSEVFISSSGTLLSKDTVGLTVKSGDLGTITLSQRDLAWKWFTEKGKASYLNFKLSFEDTNFESVTVVLETATATANKDGKAVNKIVFKKDAGKVYASVNDGETKTEVKVDSSNVLSVSINEEGVEHGEYNVVINDGSDKKIGKFTSVGAAYGEYASSTASTPLVPFRVNVNVPKAEEGKPEVSTTIRIHELNGQSFKTNDADKIVDNAKPVLVVNDEISSFLLGTAFALDYDFVDVLDKTVQKTVKYAQYNPEKQMDYKDLTTSTYFSDTQYTKDGKLTTVFAEDGMEYVSVKVTLSDEFYKDSTKVEYDLSWYANTIKTFGETDYIVLERNKEGAYYSFLTADEASAENVKSADYDSLIANYQELVTKKAEGLKPGSKTNFYLPSLIGYIGDNGGYTNLKFTISYKSTNSASASTRASLTYSNLQFPVAKSGTYLFKVFAVDKAGNSMMYYKDGELVEVDSTNVWEIEEIPTFKFEIAETSLSIEDTKESARRATVAVGKTYEKFSLTVLGDNASTAKKETKLYRINVESLKAINGVQFSQAALSSIKYEDVLKAVTNEQFVAATDYVDLYVDAYLGLLASKFNISKAALVSSNAFIEVQPYNDKITEENHAEEYAKNNAYHWDPDKQTFVAVNETDVFFLFSVYSDTQISSLKACGYQVVTVESKDDVLPGEDNWLKKNLVSVILFGVAGLMLVLIVIILLIKPSDESLEDVEEKAKAKKAKKEKKTETAETETVEVSEEDKE